MFPSVICWRVGVIGISAKPEIMPINSSDRASAVSSGPPRSAVSGRIDRLIPPVWGEPLSSVYSSRPADRLSLFTTMPRGVIRRRPKRSCVTQARGAFTRGNSARGIAAIAASASAFRAAISASSASSGQATKSAPSDPPRPDSTAPTSGIASVLSSVIASGPPPGAQTCVITVSAWNVPEAPGPKAAVPVIRQPGTSPSCAARAGTSVSSTPAAWLRSAPARLSNRRSMIRAAGASAPAGR